MAKRKQSGLPFVYARGEGFDADAIAAMDRAWDEGSAENGQNKLTRGSVAELRACIMTPREGCQVLFGGTLRRGGPPIEVRTLARFDETEFMEKRYIEVRPLLSGETSARELAACYNAWGLDGNEFWSIDADMAPQAEPVPVEAAVNIKLPSRSIVVRMRVRGLWFGLGRFAQPLPPPNRETVAPGGSAAPIAIV